MSKIILNKKNLFHNLKIISEQAKGKEKVSIVLKDNAYGHGLLEIATLVKEYGITKAVVQTVKEAEQIKELFEEILILADANFETYSHTFHIAINTIEELDKIPENTNVQLKIDTGMHRNGISKNQLKEAIYGICKRNLKFTGLFTHYKAADELNTTFYWQRSVFRQIKKETKKLCEQLSIPIPKFHSASSSALFRFNNFDEDMTRVGIATYGYLASDSTFKIPDLKPVLSLWSKKLTTRVLKKGQKVGYGGTFEACHDMVISTYQTGYGDGFLRINENQEYTTPKGYKILGRVSMDNLSLNCEEEEVCIFEDVNQLAKLHNTISYEILATLNPTIEKEIR